MILQPTGECSTATTLAGSNDCLVRYTCRDAEDLERFHTDVLMQLPGALRP